ncbi:DUF3817 domain-containing protein [Brachybacterium muris]|uniref:DUF3817 domain-containing protein n=1 Tax=Brachybacterium muris TaxID=219301 RepID=UPI0019576580|nr:DUF3817 domain-containing protein [Brachybacterium muris]MCT2176907.1 DUF3817 domain-containing protein [Brachybacterium muris]
MSRMWNPPRLYRVVAIAEVITWTMLIAGMIMKYGLRLGETGDLAVRIGGGIHGFVFLAYCVTTVLIGVDQRWGLGRILLGLGSAVVPYLTVPFERWAERKGLLGEQWRLRHEDGRGLIEKLAAFAVRRPIPAALIALVAVSVMFFLLLQAGPPWEWFS